MINAFDTDVAMIAGVNAAIIYKNIQYWCEKNRANNMNEHDGLYWTYNSSKAYKKLFPYMSEREIRYALDKLIKLEFIKVGCFNDDGRDRTKWYADLSPIINNMDLSKSDDCILQNEQMQVTKVSDCILQNEQMQVTKATNANDKSDTALPNNYTNNYKHITNKKKERKKEEGETHAKTKKPTRTFDEILDSYEVIKNTPELRDAWVGFIQMRQRIRAPLTDRALELNINKAFELAENDPSRVLKIVNNSIAQGYRGVFPVENRSQGGGQTGQKTNPFTELKKAAQQNKEAPG